MLSGQNPVLTSLPDGIQGSASALSLISTPERLIGMAVVAGVSVAVLASVSIYRAIENYEEKKHLEEIKRINALHKQYLAKIVIFDRHEFQGLPVIFQFGEKEKASEVSCLRFNDDEVEQIGTKMSQLPDIGLAIYRMEIQDAIRKLQGYYRERKKTIFGHESKKKEFDNTSAVLSYLMYILQTYCLNWEGYDIDIAYLEALYKFIREYAGLGNHENNDHFDRLKEVNKHIKQAIQNLKERQSKLSLKDFLIDLKETTSFKVNGLLRNFIRLITPVENWHFIDHAAYDELIKGKLRRQYTKKALLGHTIAVDHEKKIPDSIFKDWSELLAKYYVQSMDPDMVPNRMLMKSPAKLFVCPDFKRLTELRDKRRKLLWLSEEEDQELDRMQDELQQIKSVFVAAQHFLSVELDPKRVHKDPRFIPIKDDHKTLMRANVIAAIAILIHKIISLHYLCTHLMKSKDQLGELYLTNPEHFKNVFAVLEKLGDDISTSANAVFDEFKRIERDNENYMQLNEKLKDNLVELLDSSQQSITMLSGKILRYRENIRKNPDRERPTKQSVMHEMFATVNSVVKMYGYQDLPPVEEIKPNKNKKDKEEVGASDAPVSPVTALAPVANDNNAFINRAAPLARGSVMEEVGEEEPSKIEKIDELLKAIRDKITVIERESDGSLRKQAEVQAYRVLRNDLAGLLTKAESIDHEDNKSDERTAKAEALFDLLHLLCSDTLDFLSYSREKRIRVSATFASHVKETLNKAEYASLDLHESKFKKKLYDMGFRFFKTESRQKAGKVEMDSHLITAVLR